MLMEILKTQDLNLDLLIKSLEEQKKAIVRNDYEGLRKLLDDEQRLLKEISIEEANRIKAVNTLVEQFSIEVKNNSLAELMKAGRKYFPNDFKELQFVRSSLGEKIKKIMNLNSQLKNIISFSRQMVKELIMIIAGPNKHSLVNRRV
jgi:hypothetical protein